MAGDRMRTSGDFRKFLALYDSVVKAKASKLTKTPKRPQGGMLLLDLDKWFQRELPATITSRKEKHITHGELCKLMKWKLTRGKFRPRLTEMVQSNPADLVIEASKKAFQKLPNLSAAIQALTVLKAVGPATASAILAAGAPEQAPFMADEAVLSIQGTKPSKYNLNEYLEYAAEVKKCVQRLNKEDSEQHWTPHKVEIALWTHETAKQICPDVLKGEESELAEDQPSKKKAKTA